jgi:hypothetical protein
MESKRLVVASASWSATANRVHRRSPERRHEA